jgi:hypothetical protein
MKQIIGDFLENLAPRHEYVFLGFSPDLSQPAQRWRRNGLSADFLGEYAVSCMTAPREEHHQAQTLKGAVSYIANELLENASKFHLDQSKQPIRMVLQVFEDKLVFVTANYLTPGPALARYQAFAERLSSSEPSVLYLQQMEENAANPDAGGSGLGYLSMLNDYGAKLGWCFEREDAAEWVTVTTMVQLPL